MTQDVRTFNPMTLPYPSRRYTVYGKKGMVATSHPLAAQAGLAVLQQGGNAIDAAIAAASTLTVVEPTSNGIGGDAFALVWNNGKLHGLNASGPAPMACSIQSLSRMGLKEMPTFGWYPVTVPGIPSAWAALSTAFGRLPLTRSLMPAIDFAEHGHPVAPVVAKYWELAHRRYAREFTTPEYKAWFETFAPQNRAPNAGELWSSPDHAGTLRLIAETSAEAFYRGVLAEKIDAFSRQSGGLLRYEDLAAFQPEWVNPIHTNYRGYDVWEIPPNGQGIVALMALNILEGFEFDGPGTKDTVHKQLEAIKLSFASAKQTVTDARFMKTTTTDLLSKAFAAEQRQRISDGAGNSAAVRPDSGGTVYLATADSEGNMVSYIQSNYMGFGSGIVVPGTGIGFQNRGHTFSLDVHHINAIAPGKRTYHTIIPGFLTKDGHPIGPFGVMGGFMQPQGHVQVIMNTVDFGLNPQAALDAPRWQWLEGQRIIVESEFDAKMIAELQANGHDISVETERGSFGRGQIIWRLSNGVLAGGTEPRADGHVAVW